MCVRVCVREVCFVDIASVPRDNVGSCALDDSLMSQQAIRYIRVSPTDGA